MANVALRQALTAPTAPQKPANYMDLQKQQALVDAMREQANSPIQYDPRGAISPFQGLAKLFQAYSAGSGQKEIDSTTAAERQKIGDAAKTGDFSAIIAAMQSSQLPGYQDMALKSQIDMELERQKGSSRLPEYKVVGGSVFNTGTGEFTPAPSNAPVDPETGQPERKLSATEQKELFDTMDLANSGEAAVGALTKAKDILTSSPKGAEPYTGFGAEVRASAARLPVIGDVVADKERGAATTEYKTLVTEQALNNLKAIFGGMPTEGERAILMQMQALPSYTPEEQQRIIDNAVSAANKRLEFNKKKSGAIRTGQYSQMGKPFKDASPTADTGQPAMISTQEEFDALPSGTLYMEDDGQTYRKP